MGCGSAIEAPREARFGEGSGPIWMDDVHCNYDDTKLQNCTFKGWGSHNCDHDEDASVICQNGM